MNDDCIRIVLSGEAKKAHDQMLVEVRADEKTSINSSKLINWIVADYYENFFKKRKHKLLKAHFNSRKCVMEAMKAGDPEQIRRALQEAARRIPLQRTSKTKKQPIVSADAVVDSE